MNRFFSKKINIVQYLLIPIAIFLTFSFTYNNYEKLLPVSYYDEFLWVGRSYFLDEYITGNFSDQLWQKFQSYDQSKLAEYYYGLNLYPNYLEYKKENNIQDFSDYLDDHNLIERSSTKEIYFDASDYGYAEFYVNKYGEESLKTYDLIREARRNNIFVLSLSVIAVYFFALIFKDIFFAILFSSIYGLNPLLIEASLIAHSEALFLLFFNASLLMLSSMFINKKVSNTQLAIIAILSGLSISTKLNGAMILILFLFLNFFSLVIHKKLTYSDLTKKIIQNLSVIIVSFIIFILINPFTFSAPITNTGKMFIHRISTADGQATILHPDLLLPTPASRLTTIFENFYFNSKKVYFNQILFAEDKTTPDQIIFTKTTPITSLYNTNTFLLFIIGIIISIKKTIQKKRRYIIILFSFLTILVITSLYLKLDWPRYYVHLTFFFLFFQAITIYHLFIFLTKHTNHKLLKNLINKSKKQVGKIRS